MKRYITGLFAVMATFVFSSSADAAFRLRVDNGTTTGVAITDNGAGDLWTSGQGHDYDGANSIVFAGSVGTFSLNVTTGVKSPAFQSPGSYVGIDLSNISINSSGAGTLRLILEADGFDIPADGEILEVTNQTGGVLSSPGGSVTFTSYANHDNGTPDLGADNAVSGAIAAVNGIGTAPAVSTSLTFNDPPSGAFSGTSVTSFVKSGTYSLYTVVEINFTQAGSISFNNTTATSPAPAGLVLALSAAPFGLGAWLRRRRSRTAKA